jgi:hypothetical protein
MDAMGMNLERRMVAEICTEPDNIISARVFSDGSPATGTEIQGMVLEIFTRDREWPMNIIMPGMSLMYGRMRTIDKAIAFLWALWLVAGPGKVTYTMVLMVQRRTIGLIYTLF